MLQLSLNHNKSESKRNRNCLMANMNKSSGDLLRTMQLVILIFISTVSTLLIAFSFTEIEIKNITHKKTSFEFHFSFPSSDVHNNYQFK